MFLGPVQPPPALKGACKCPRALKWMPVLSGVLSPEASVAGLCSQRALEMEGWGCESNGQAHGAGSTWALSVCVCHSGLAQLGERERVCTATVGWQLEMPAPNLVTLGSWRTVPGSTHAGTSTHTCACAHAHAHTQRHAYTCCTRRCAHRQAWAQKVHLHSWCRGFLFQQCLTAHPPTTELGFPQLPFSGPLLRGPCTGHGRGDAWAVLASVQESGALDGSPAGHM